ARRLHQEHIGAANVLVDLKRDFRVRKPAQPGLPEADAQKRCNFPRELRVRAAREDFQFAEPDRHEGVTHITCQRRVRGRGPCALPTGTSGWGGRIRTFEYGIQSPAPYRLATPHHVSLSTPTANRNVALAVTAVRSRPVFAVTSLQPGARGDRRLGVERVSED